MSVLIQNGTVLFRNNKVDIVTGLADDCVCCGTSSTCPGGGSPALTPDGGIIVADIPNTLTFEYELDGTNFGIIDGCCVRIRMVTKTTYTINGLAALNGTYPSIVLRSAEPTGPCETYAAPGDIPSSGCGVVPAYPPEVFGCKRFVFIPQVALTGSYTASREVTVLDQRSGYFCADKISDWLAETGPYGQANFDSTWTLTGYAQLELSIGIPNDQRLSLTVVPSAAPVGAQVAAPSHINFVFRTGTCDAPPVPSQTNCLDPCGFRPLLQCNCQNKLGYGTLDSYDFLPAPLAAACYPRDIPQWSMPEYSCDTLNWDETFAAIDCPAFDETITTSNPAYPEGTFPACDVENIDTSTSLTRKWNGSGITSNVSMYEV